MTADNLQVNFVTKVPYFFKHECHGHFEDNQHILYQELGTDIFQVCTKQTVRTRPRNLDNNEMESYHFKVDECVKQQILVLNCTKMTDLDLQISLRF